MKTPKLQVIELDALEHVSGGMNLDGLPLSDNIEDRRPQSDGGPVPDADWQAEQNGYNNSCFIGADGQEYSGDPSGGPAQPMDVGGGGDGGGGDGGGGDGGGE